MKPGALAVAVISSLAIGSFAYRHFSGRSPYSAKQVVLRDALGEGDFNPNVKQALTNDNGVALPSVKGVAVETSLKVFDSPSLANIQKAIANLKEAEKLALDYHNRREGLSYSWFIGKAREALQDGQVKIVKSFGARVYCGRTLQFRQNDEEDQAANACDFQQGGSVCYQGDPRQARDLIMAAASLGYWDGDDENEIKAWIHDGKLLLNIRNEGEPMAKMEIIPCR